MRLLSAFSLLAHVAFLVLAAPCTCAAPVDAAEVKAHCCCGPGAPNPCVPDDGDHSGCSDGVACDADVLAPATHHDTLPDGGHAPLHAAARAPTATALAQPDAARPTPLPQRALRPPLLIARTIVLLV